MPAKGQKKSLALKNRLDAAFSRAEKLAKADVDMETQADHTKYLCVLVSGFVETAIPELVIEYCRKQASPKVLNYVMAQVSKLQNVNEEKLSRLVRSFDTIWAEELTEFLKQDGRKEALNSIVSLRNKIAHGESVAQMSFSRMRDYYKKIITIINFIEGKFS